MTDTIYQFDISMQYIGARQRLDAATAPRAGATGSGPRPGGAARPGDGRATTGAGKGRIRGCPLPGRGITLGGVSFRPGSLEGVQTSPTGGRVEYLLARNAVVREYRKGRLVPAGCL